MARAKIRTHMLRIRLTEDEREMFERAAVTRGLSVSAFLRLAGYTLVELNTKPNPRTRSKK